jgi:uncharacterized caspase-like protein
MEKREIGALVGGSRLNNNCSRWLGSIATAMWGRKPALARLFGARWLAVSLVLVWVAGTNTPGLAGGRVALVIGNADYASLGRLANPVHDADAIAATLHGMGFQVTKLANLDVYPFAKALSDFRRLAVGADVALVYYSGHGLQLHSENYLIPVDATLDFDTSLKYQSIALDDVLDALSGSRTALVFVDACRTIPVDGTFLANSNERAVATRGPAPVHVEHQGRNLFVGFSSSTGQTAEDGSGNNSPFTIAMVEQLPQRGLDVVSMFAAVSDEVRHMTEGRQVPQAFSDLPPDVALVAAAVSSPAPDAHDQERAYNAAQSVGTVNAYRAFLASFPAGFYAELAREQIGRLEGAASEPPTSPELAPDEQTSAEARVAAHSLQTTAEAALPAHVPTLSVLASSQNAPQPDTMFAMVRKSLGVNRLAELDGATLCLVTGDADDAVGAYFRGHNMQYSPVSLARADAFQAYDAGRCDALVATGSDLESARAALAVPSDSVILAEGIAN